MGAANAYVGHRMDLIKSNRQQCVVFVFRKKGFRTRRGMLCSPFLASSVGSFDYNIYFFLSLILANDSRNSPRLEIIR